MIQKRTITVNSGHPASSKWWWIGDMRNTRLPNPRNEITCTITDIVSITYSPPRMTRSSWVFVVIASAPSSPPRQVQAGQVHPWGALNRYRVRAQR